MKNISTAWFVLFVSLSACADQGALWECQGVDSNGTKTRVEGRGAYIGEMFQQQIYILQNQRSGDEYEDYAYLSDIQWGDAHNKEFSVALLATQKLEYGTFTLSIPSAPESEDGLYRAKGTVSFEPSGTDPDRLLTSDRYQLDCTLDMGP